MSVLPNAVSQRFKYFLQPQRVAMVEACLIGLVSGLAAVLLQYGIGALGTLRLVASTLGPPWIILPLCGLVGGLLAGWLIEHVEPTANGSGIPQVKVALAQLPMPLNFRVAIAKLISTMLALGSGLMLGRQGPTVQVGASLAAQLSYWLPTVPGHRRQMIAAGAGAGLAAGFNAPLAGVLFVIEILLQDLSGLTLGTAIIASFIGAVVARVLGGQSFSIILSQAEANTSFSVPEIPFYIFLGILAGILGGLFNQGLIQGLDRGHRYFKLPLMVRIALVGSLSGFVMGFMPDIFRNNAGLRDLLSYSNDLTWQFVAIAFGLQFILTILAYSSDAPGGVFAPSLVLGAALGHLVGIAQAQVLGAGDIVTYSLVGMGAFFGAVSRVPITGIVIIFEMTTDFNLVLPLMISAIVAFFVAERVQPGSIYDQLLLSHQASGQTKKYQSRILDRLSAADIMQRRVETLSSQLPFRDVKDAFAKSHHRGFPVVEAGRLVGIISQSDLTSVARTQFDDDSPLREIMTPSPITVMPDANLSEVLYLLNHYSLSRLPVVDGRKLVGIITRADIIRAESEELSEEGYRLQPRLEPSYVVYQTRSPATGTGRMLVPLANPKTAPLLLHLAMAIAQEFEYEVECLRVITVPSDRPLTEAQVDMGPSQQLLDEATDLGKMAGVNVHTQIKVAHDVARAILETEKDRLIDVLLMGWEGRPAPTDRIFGSVVDTVFRQSAGQVLLVKLGQQPHLRSMRPLNRWLVPISGGPNVQAALKLVPAFGSIANQMEIELCLVQNRPSPIKAGHPLLKAKALLQSLTRAKVNTRLLYSDEVADAILQMADSEQTDVIMLGASREGVLKQVLNGNIPERIARESKCIVIVAKGAELPQL